ncbi:MAG: UbiX family flavin prenyltransferase [Syntrophomonadaceae bacterium]
MSRYVIGITGASGIVYAVKLIQELTERDNEVHIIASKPALIVAEQELGWEYADDWMQVWRKYIDGEKVFFYDNSDIAAKIASGSFITEGMVIIPTTMSTLAAVAGGLSNNLIERSADVAIKEKRRLIMVPRETPLSSVHLRNMLTLADMGVHIIPAMPGFYHNPRTIEDLVNFLVGKVLDSMGIYHNLFKRYKQ